MKSTWTFLALSLLISSRAFGDLLVSTFGDPQEQHASFQEHQYLAQQFSIPNAVVLSDVRLVFVDNSGPSFGGQFQIVDKIGESATAANVRFTVPITLPSDIDPNIVQLSTPVFLSPGAYYLLLSTSDQLPLQTRWQLTSSSMSGTFGAAGGAFFSDSQNVSLPVASPFSSFDDAGFPPPTFLAFEINGSVVSVPELGAQFPFGVIFAAMIIRKGWAHYRQVV